MAVLKAKETRFGMAVCRQDRVYKHFKSNFIPTRVSYRIFGLGGEIGGPLKPSPPDLAPVK